MYLNLFHKEEIKTLEELIKLQEKNTKAHFPKAIFKYSQTIKRADGAKTLLRTIFIDGYPTEEYTGFIEFKDFFVFIVLFSPKELIRKNIRKLENILERIIPGRMDQSPALNSKLKEFEASYNDLDTNKNKSENLTKQGDILASLKRYEEANFKYDKAIKILETNYGAFKGKLRIAFLIKTTRKDLVELVEKFCELEPTNPTLATELLELFSIFKRSSDAVYFLRHEANKYKNNSEAFGNFNYHLGLLLLDLKRNSSAEKHLLIAKSAFREVFQKDHIIFKYIDKNLKKIKK
ncbi:MAG TPA: hypothetical protein VG621_03675 [Candidatus Paceibacterota bacterium]|nr:hypothetical protein [Candidatus Paceibacterota bacterium]